MTTDFSAVNQYAYDYNPRKEINKSGLIGAGIGMATAAGLQYGGSELLLKNADKILCKTITTDNKILSKLMEYLSTCCLLVSNNSTKWIKTGVAGIVGATIVGLASALSAAKKHLP